LEVPPAAPSIVSTLAVAEIGSVISLLIAVLEWTVEVHNISYFGFAGDKAEPRVASEGAFEL
jgi:hypothetical protein